MDKQWDRQQVQHIQNDVQHNTVNTPAHMYGLSLQRKAGGTTPVHQQAPGHFKESSCCWWE
jgi:hypothetical protein